MSFVKGYVFAVLGLLIHLGSFAHGDLDERIAVVAAEIEAAPDSAFLYLKRGELYYQHEEYTKATEDFNHCLSTGYWSPRLSVSFAKANFSLANFPSALHYLDQVLTEDEHHVIAWRWRGHTLMALTRFEEAAHSYEQVLLLANKTFTENYLEVAKAWQQSPHPQRIARAIKAIEAGLEHLGPLLILHDNIVLLHESNQDYAAAIDQQTIIIELAKRKEFPLVKRAELYISTGNHTAAKADLQAARDAVEHLSPFRRKNGGIISLLKRIENLEESL